VVNVVVGCARRLWVSALNVLLIAVAVVAMAFARPAVSQPVLRSRPVDLVPAVQVAAPRLGGGAPVAVDPGGVPSRDVAGSGRAGTWLAVDGCDLIVGSLRC
jgi:hypothetical protein